MGASSHEAEETASEVDGAASTVGAFVFSFLASREKEGLLVSLERPSPTEPHFVSTDFFVSPICPAVGQALLWTFCSPVSHFAAWVGLSLVREGGRLRMLEVWPARQNLQECLERAPRPPGRRCSAKGRPRSESRRRH